LTACHFPPPWIVEKKFAHFVVRDADGKAPAHIYFVKEQLGHASVDKLLSKDEAQRDKHREAAATVTGRKITKPPQLPLYFTAVPPPGAHMGFRFRYALASNPGRLSTTERKRLRANVRTCGHGGSSFWPRTHPQLVFYPGRRRRPPV
jgi:hypothetical protein